MRLPLLLLALLVSLPASAQSSGGVFFSEYIEGSSNNKALEIYNGTGSDVELDSYTVEFYYNGATGAGLTIPLSGTLAAGDVYVLAHSSADAAILSVADLTNGAGWFNGNDAVTLLDANGLIDAIGQIGENPGDEWGTGDASTQNNTLRRLADVCAGDTDGTDAFDPVTSWTGFPQNTFDGLGTHSATCSSSSNTPPAFTSATLDTTVRAGVTLTYDFDAEDAEGDAITYALASAPGGAAINANTGVFTWTPADADADRTFDIRVTASDGDRTSIESGRVAVVPANPPPVFTAAAPDTIVHVGEHTFTYAATLDGQPASLSIVDAPPGATLDGGTLSVNLPAIGTYAVTVAAEAGGGRAEYTSVIGAFGQIAPSLDGAALADELRRLYAPDRTLGYDTARDTMYLRVDRARDGFVEGIYSGYSVFLPLGVDPSTHLFEHSINAEHVWPQSMGAGEEPMRSDMHHLFPARANVNSARGNRRHAEIPDADADSWFYLDQVRSTPPSENRDAWSESDNQLDTFEPREAVKGDVARALAYFWVMYPDAADAAFARSVRDAFDAGWTSSDPPSGAEAARTHRISRYQGNINPFVLDPTLFSRLSLPPPTSTSAERAPEAFTARLSAPYPNPARSVVTVPFEVMQPGPVRLAVYDVLGREVAVLADRHMPRGDFTAEWTPRGAAGLYLVRLETSAGQASTTVTVTR